MVRARASAWSVRLGHFREIANCDRPAEGQAADHLCLHSAAAAASSPATTPTGPNTSPPPARCQPPQQGSAAETLADFRRLFCIAGASAASKVDCCCIEPIVGLCSSPSPSAMQPGSGCCGVEPKLGFHRATAFAFTVISTDQRRRLLPLD